jgi:hypothetical protein
MRIRFLSLLVLVSAALAGCNKPTEDECQKAVDNINKLYGLGSDKADTAPAVRKCRASAKRSDVLCKIAATTSEQLDACDGKTPKPKK